MSFAAFITSFLSIDDLELRRVRSEVVQRQINWWLEHTEVPVFVTSMNYEPSDYLVHPRLTYVDTLPMKANPARKLAFERFYESDYDFGIFMDDDAILYNKEQHNSGAKLFAEMSAHIEDYKSIDVFFPVNPQKIGFNPLWDKTKPVSTTVAVEALQTTNHVFKRSMDLKGSMFIVRNFRKFGMTEVYPDPEFNWQDDTKFAIECVAAGHTVLQCENIILHEISGKASNFAANPSDRIPHMKAGNTRIAEEFAHLGLRMDGDSHLLDRTEFLKKTWIRPKRFVIPKIKDNSIFF
jgi:hypothetical protein